MFRFNKNIIREPTVCASLKLRYWRQLKYFVIELLGRVAAYNSVLLVCVSCTVQSETVSHSALCTVHIPTGLNNTRPHDRTV
jgi:hypothetical protein